PGISAGAVDGRVGRLGSVLRPDDPLIVRVRCRCSIVEKLDALIALVLREEVGSDSRAVMVVAARARGPRGGAANELLAIDHIDVARGGGGAIIVRRSLARLHPLDLGNAREAPAHADIAISPL